MSKLTYTKVGDYYIPNIILSDQPEKPIGKYGRMRKQYLKEHRTLYYNHLILEGRLHQHQVEIDEAAKTRMDILLPQYMRSAGVNEELKAADQMKWVGLMNTLKAQIEEIIQNELIYG